MVTNTQAMDFFRKFNQGEFLHQRLGQAFLNHFKIDCNERHDEDPARTCLFHLCNDGAAAKRIWKEWVNG